MTFTAMPDPRPANWVFLGDSLTEGIGSKRVTYVSELAKQLRRSETRRAVHDIRLREVDPDQFNRFIRVNLAGYLSADDRAASEALWLWNLGSESQTIEYDIRWLPFLQNLRPERVFIHRGSLESILRPHCWANGGWPWWVPRSWRGLVSMDPRCYFSDTWWRHLKQTTVDAAKQTVRHRLLRDAAAAPLMAMDTFLAHYRDLVRALRQLPTRITILGLLPPEERTFPGSAAHFGAVNAQLCALAAECRSEFLDWAADFNQAGASRFYRDGFHPSAEGAGRMAAILHEHLQHQ